MRLVARQDVARDDGWRALLSISATCTWCHGAGSATVAGVPVVCTCRPFDVVVTGDDRRCVIATGR